VQAAARAFLRTGLPAGAWDELFVVVGIARLQTYRRLGCLCHRPLAWPEIVGIPARFFLQIAPVAYRSIAFRPVWRGFNIAQDAGTYLYNAVMPWDNPLVSTRVHNTVTVDGRDQMTRLSRFLTLDWVSAYSKRLLQTDENVLGCLVAYHKGYRRLGIRHERVAKVLQTSIGKSRII